VQYETPEGNIKLIINEESFITPSQPRATHFIIVCNVQSVEWSVNRLF